MHHLQLPLQREKVRKEISSKTITNVVHHFFRLIKLSSPNLNYLIGAGAIILYVDIYLLVVPTTDQPTVQVLCSVTPWLTAIGYSLCYGTIVAKMVRVYLIFNNPKPNSTNVRMSFQTPFALRHPFPSPSPSPPLHTAHLQTMKDWKLATGVLVLVLVDLVILVVYTAIETSQGVEVRTTLNRENPSRSEQVSWW